MSTIHFLGVTVALLFKSVCMVLNKIKCSTSRLAIPKQVVYITVMIGSLLVVAGEIAWAEVVVSDPYGNGSFLGLPAIGTGGGATANIHRAVLYNHGGKGFQEGGDLHKTVRKLAEEGFIAYAKKRSGISISQTLGEVQDGLDELLNLTSIQLAGRSIVSGSNDPGVSLLGYSRGGLMALRLAELQATSTKSFVKIDKVIVQAAAPGEDLSVPGTSGQWVIGGASTFEDAVTMDGYLSDGSIGGTDNIGMIDAAMSEFFLLAANNDQPPHHPDINHVDLVTTVHNQLVNRGVISDLKIYDNWRLPESGHQLFESVVDGGQDLLNLPGYYWRDVIHHLNGQSITPSTTLIPEPRSATVWLLGTVGLALFQQRRIRS